MSDQDSEERVVVAPHGRLGSCYLTSKPAADRLRTMLRLKARFALAWGLTFAAYCVAPLVIEVGVMCQMLWLVALVLILFGGTAVIEYRIRQGLKGASEIERGFIHYRKSE